MIQSGFSAEATADAVAYVKDYGYINDSRYALNYILGRIHDRSRQKIFQQLLKRESTGKQAETAWEEAVELENPNERKATEKNSREALFFWK